MDLTKVKTGSVGPDGQPIYDVFSGTEHIQSPTDPRLQGVDINSLPDGVAPTGFQSQFQPVSIQPKDEVPNAALEGAITRGDINRLMRENQTNFQTQLDSQNKVNQDLFNQTLQKMQLTPEEKAAQDRLLGLQQLQDQAVQQVQERPLDGTVLKSGLQNEINNITTGNTRESLVNLRKQQFEAQRLQVLQGQRQQELDALKLQLDQGNINTDNLFKAQTLMRENQNDYLNRVQTLTENARTSLATILDRFQGLTLDKISGESLKTITQLAAQAGIPLDILRDGMKTVADQISLEQKLKQYEAETDRLNKLKSNETPDNSPKVQALQTKLTNIDNIINHDGLDSRVGVTSADRRAFAIGDKFSGAGQDFAASVHQLVSQDTLDTLLNLKAKGGTLGALSDQERLMLQNAATKIADWEIRNEAGQGTGEWAIDEGSFIKELNEIKRLTNVALTNAGGTSNVTDEDKTEVENIYGVFNPASFY